MMEDHEKAFEQLRKDRYPHAAPPDTTKVPQRRDPKPAPGPKAMPPDYSRTPQRRDPQPAPQPRRPGPQRRDAPKTDERGMYRK